MKLTSPKTIKELMEGNGLRFNKSFGQNFLIAESVPRDIADGCGVTQNDCVLEIGPGIGSLTVELAKRAKKVVSVEIDGGLIPVLQQTTAEFDNVKIINSDILKVDLGSLCREEFSGSDIYVCANLPYYITTPIIMFLLESGVKFRSITVMVQKEVAQRLASHAGDADYGAVTAAVSCYGEVKKLFPVSRGCFMPAPNVDSAVISIVPYEVLPFEVKDRAMLSKIIRGAFAKRRKTLANSLSSEFPNIGKEDITKIIEDCGFSAQIRGETLSVSDFAKLADGFSNHYESK